MACIEPVFSLHPHPGASYVLSRVKSWCLLGVRISAKAWLYVRSMCVEFHVLHIFVDVHTCGAQSKPFLSSIPLHFVPMRQSSSSRCAVW